MLHNHTQLGLYSSSKLGVSWRNRYDPIHPLDVVMFKDRDIREDETNSVESYSGLYVVSRVGPFVRQQHVQHVGQAEPGSPQPISDTANCASAPRYWPC